MLKPEVKSCCGRAGDRGSEGRFAVCTFKSETVLPLSKCFMQLDYFLVGGQGLGR